MTTEAQPKPDEFDAAFSQFAADEKPADPAPAAEGGTPSETPAAETPPAPAAEGGTPQAEAIPAPAAETPAAPAETPSGATAPEGGAAPEAKASDGGQTSEQPAAAPAPAAEGPSADDILAGLKKLVGEQPAAAPSAEAPASQPEAKPVYNQEEQEFITQYQKDWADVAKGEALMRRAEYKELMDYIFAQVLDYVKPIHETAEVLAERTFRSELNSTVPDYSDNLREQVIEWAKTQPAYLQPGYNYVITQGTVDEVKDLIDRYRAATGQATQASAQTPAAATSQPKPGTGNELSEQAKQAAAALAPVDSKRSGVQAPSDPTNFEDAWKRAAAELG